MNIIAMIPARYEASRFPGKLLADLNGKSVIQRTYEAALKTQLFKEIYVVTDSPKIKKAVVNFGGQVIMSQKPHKCGSDRIAEAVADRNVDIVVNIQGDTPFVKKEPLEKLIEVFYEKGAAEIALASLMQKMENPKEIKDPNYVKVVVDKNNFALYFSRAPIPYPCEKNSPAKYFEHIGVYAFRKKALMDFYSFPMLDLEASEKIECLRYLEYGRKIKMIQTDFMGIEIDTPEDLERAKLCT